MRGSTCTKTARALGFVDLLFRSRKQPPRVFKLRQRERVSRYKLKRPRPRRNKDREHQLLSSSIYTHTQTKLYMQTLKKNKKRARHKTQSLCQQRAPFFSQKVHTQSALSRARALLTVVDIFSFFSLDPPIFPSHFEVNPLY